MHIEIQLTGARIDDPRPIPPELAAAAGAWIHFAGVVREIEGDGPIAALEYEAHPEMAVRQMRRILDELNLVHPCLAARVVHRLGIVPVGEAAISVHVAATHRAEAFALLAAFLGCVKRDVPIWKVRTIPRPDSMNMAIPA